MKISSKNSSLYLFVLPFLVLGLAHAEPKQPVYSLKPVFVANVSETTALGYVNGTKFIVDSKGAVTFSAVTIGPNNAPAICVYRTATPSPRTKDFKKVWINNTDSLNVSQDPHFATTLCPTGTASQRVVWSGGRPVKSPSPELAHQLRFARIEPKGAMRVVEMRQPFTVAGFDAAYKPPYGPVNLWQEYPCAAATKDGRMHVVWEGRDSHHTNTENRPVPGIAYAVRSASGNWSVEGEVDAPPYLDVAGVSALQMRPVILATRGAEPIHLLCSGDVHGRLQVLYGQIFKGKFSGWSVVAASETDQRQVSAALDGRDRLHVVWRESDADSETFLSYSMRAADGTWTEQAFIDDGARYASLPTIAVDETAVYVAWIGWEEGFENSDHLKNNGFPEDNDTVEGQLEFAAKRFDETEFSSPATLSGGMCSYPHLAKRSRLPDLSIVWTAGQECLPHDCVQLYYGVIQKK